MFTAEWQTIAVRRGKDGPWYWRLDELERIAFSRRVDLRQVETRLHRPSEGVQEMQARDRQAFLLRKAVVAIPGIEEAPQGQRQSPGPASAAASAAIIGQRRVAIVYLPRAKPIGMRTYVPHHADPARWCDRREPRVAAR